MPEKHEKIAKHKLHTHRTEAGLTQKALSDISDVSTSTISNIECHRGPDVPAAQRRRTKTRFSTIEKLVLGLYKNVAEVGSLPAGEYAMSFFLSQQEIFTEDEVYELFRLRNPRPRNNKSVVARPRRHLKPVAA